MAATSRRLAAGVRQSEVFGSNVNQYRQWLCTTGELPDLTRLQGFRLRPHRPGRAAADLSQRVAGVDPLPN